jgi:hypothetical protein
LLRRTLFWYGTGTTRLAVFPFFLTRSMHFLFHSEINEMWIGKCCCISILFSFCDAFKAFSVDSRIKRTAGVVKCGWKNALPLEHGEVSSGAW